MAANEIVPLKLKRVLPVANLSIAVLLLVVDHLTPRLSGTSPGSLALQLCNWINLPAFAFSNLATWPFEHWLLPVCAIQETTICYTGIYFWRLAVFFAGIYVTWYLVGTSFGSSELKRPRKRIMPLSVRIIADTSLILIGVLFASLGVYEVRFWSWYSLKSATIEASPFILWAIIIIFASMRDLIRSVSSRRASPRANPGVAQSGD